MQSVRTAGQKALTNEVSAVAATLVRYLYGLPFVLIYLAFLWSDSTPAKPILSSAFFLPAFAAGCLQVLATFLMIRLFMLRNFAVGSTYVRSEILLTAIIGALFFAEPVSAPGWAAIVLCVLGLVLVSVAKSGGLVGYWNRSAVYGLSAGLAFSLTSLFIRSASLSLGLDSAPLAAAITLAFMVCMQTVISLAWVCWNNAAELIIVMRRWRISLFIGLTSIVGSAGWFTAFTLERAAYVKTVGQVEFVMTLLISVLYFKEVPNRAEFAGMCLLIVGVVVLLLSP